MEDRSAAQQASQLGGDRGAALGDVTGDPAGADELGEAASIVCMPYSAPVWMAE